MRRLFWAFILLYAQLICLPLEIRAQARIPGPGGSSAAAAGIALVSFSNSNTGGSIIGSITVAAPTSITNGNLLFATFIASPAGATLTPPAGWSTACAQQDTGNGSIYSFKKIASGESGDYTFTVSGSSPFISGSISNWSGTSASTPYDTCGTIGSGTGTTATATTLTTAVANEVVLFIQGNDDGSGTPGIPSGYASCGSVDVSGSFEGYSCGYKVVAASGATGSLTASTPNGPWYAVQNAIRP